MMPTSNYCSFQAGVMTAVTREWLSETRCALEMTSVCASINSNFSPKLQTRPVKTCLECNLPWVVALLISSKVYLLLERSMPTRWQCTWIGMRKRQCSISVFLIASTSMATGRTTTSPSLTQHHHQKQLASTWLASSSTILNSSLLQHQLCPSMSSHTP